MFTHTRMVPSRLLLAVGATHDGHFEGDATDVAGLVSNHEASGNENKDTIGEVVGREEHGATYKSDHAVTAPMAP
jgi:hypothetical protein